MCTIAKKRLIAPILLLAIVFFFSIIVFNDNSVFKVKSFEYESKSVKEKTKYYNDYNILTWLNSDLQQYQQKDFNEMMQMHAFKKPNVSFNLIPNMLNVSQRLKPEKIHNQILSDDIPIFRTTAVKSSPKQIDSDPIREFYKTHDKISKEKNSTLRKIFFSQPRDGGYGNRMYVFISSALISILLDCQLVLDWKSKEDLYVEPPLNLFDKVQVNEGFNSTSENQIFFLPHASYEFRSVKLIHKLIEKPYELPQDYMRYVHGRVGPLFPEISANVIYYEKLKHYNLTRNETLNEAFTALKNNGNYSNTELQRRVLNVAFEVGGNILNKMWTPNEEIKSLQMRAGDSNYLDETRDHLIFIDCALQIEQDHILSTKNVTNTFFKWFIATDSDRIRKSIFDNFGNKSFTSNGTLAHTDSQSQDGFRRALLDVELLSKCNEIVVTGGSTFGWLAAMKSLRLPFFINGRNRMNKCLRSNLSDPPSGGPVSFASF